MKIERSAAERVFEVIRRDELRMACLRAVRELALPDAWIGAGFVRNAVWDAMVSRTSDPTQHDVDVLFFDPSWSALPVAEAEQRERILEARLTELVPALAGQWSVTNQARMAGYNGDEPYRNTEHAISHWAETATAIALRLDTNDEMQLIAPHGLADLFAHVVRRSPAFANKHEAWAARLAAKRWLERWPTIRIVDDV
ncbi:hypothetical protein AKJ09_00137 [Labilithrix luteola]|uniref:Nucleotidyltransferase family protein n=1 Tax=Labilithrix luteola TaxID=1391654 RepID=A0A0K1PIV4_9BACT|nr:nucleotidyltransferase family protein [Labilithrix luteola]AKU93473.1 hypothetical protein AKJ09_00137 [Labilithrix luteola]